MMQVSRNSFVSTTPIMATVTQHISRDAVDRESLHAVREAFEAERQNHAFTVSIDTAIAEHKGLSHVLRPALKEATTLIDGQVVAKADDGVTD